MPHGWDQGLTRSNVCFSSDMIGQDELALSCGTDRDEGAPPVLSHLFLRHPFCAINNILDTVSSFDILLIPLDPTLIT